MSETTPPALPRAESDVVVPVYASRRERRLAEAAAPAPSIPEGPAHTVSASAVESAPTAEFAPTAGSAPAPSRRSSRAAATGPRAVRRSATTSPGRRARAATAPRPRRSVGEVLAEARRSLVAGGVMIVAAGLAVGMSVPSAALQFSAPSQEDVDDSASAEGAQSLTVDDSTSAAAPTPDARDPWTVGASAAVQMAAYQASTGGYAAGYVPTFGSIRWPFPYSTSMSSGYGEDRGGGEIHDGLDFNPGVGSPIHSIADGVVTWVGWNPIYGYGYYVTIEHTVNGVTVESLYAHMIDGSSSLSVGQKVSVGDQIGLVGNTGYSTGPHLHLELVVGGVSTDPYSWLTENATNE